MSNLTLTIDEDLLRRARMRALEQGTSVNAVVREYLQDYAGESSGQAALDDLFERMDRVSAGSGPRGRTWTREELYDRGRR